MDHTYCMVAKILLTKNSINEIDNIERLVKIGSPDLMRYNPHKVNIKGTIYFSYDAKNVNKELGHDYRGPIRYFFKEGKFISVGDHNSSTYGLRLLRSKYIN